jgi:hypothetical protein
MSYLNVIGNPGPFSLRNISAQARGESISSFVSALQHAVPQFAEFAIQDVTAFQEG